MPYEYDPEALTAAEADIRQRLDGAPVNLEVQRAISNIYRAATVISRSAEREILGERNLSWSGFTMLWVLWVWGEMDSTRLAAEVGLTPGTVTGVRKNLESENWTTSRRGVTDGRQVMISLTPEGTKMFDELYPRFNAWSADLVSELSDAGTTELANLLQHVIVQPASHSVPE